MFKYAASLLFAAILAFGVVAASSHPKTGLSGQPDKFLDLLNQERIELELEPFEVDAYLTECAEDHARNMHRYGYCAHVYWDGEEYVEVRDYFGLPYSVGEVVLMGAKSGGDALWLWKGSAGHWAWLTHPYRTKIGVGKAANYWSAFIE